MKVCFLLKDLRLAGGVGVVVYHTERLAADHGFEVTLALTNGSEDLEGPVFDPDSAVRVISAREAKDDLYDVAVGTWWETVYELFEMPARRHAYFVQSLEERFYPQGEPERLGAAISHDLPLALISEARWIVDVLEELRPGVPCHYVRNGIDKDLFSIPEQAPAHDGGPLRVLIEGHPDVPIKGVGEAQLAASMMTEAHQTTLISPGPFKSRVTADRVLGPVPMNRMPEIYREADVLLKLSRVEGMFGPPLEAFHEGATCVVTPVTGHDEYVEHGWNGFVADWDDPRGTARLLDLLARDRTQLQYLRTNALETARGWPSQQQSASEMAAALQQIATDPAPQPGPGIFGSVLIQSEFFANETFIWRSRMERRTLAGKLKHSRLYENRLVYWLLTPLRLLYKRRRRG